MHASMPPDALPPDDAREPDAPEPETNVVDPEVLAERRAHRAEQSERSAVRRAADAQTLAAELARERARLEAERDAARAEAAAAREGADAVKAEARFVQAERDALRTECELLRSGGAAAPVAHEPTNGNGAAAPAAAWADGLRAELAVARSAAARPAPVIARAATAVATPSPSLARERGLVARRAQDAPSRPVPTPPTVDRAAPVTALALERERSGRLQAQLERAAAGEQAAREQGRERSQRLQAQLDRAAVIERELREQVVALERAVVERREAEQRIEEALRRMRAEFDAVNRLAAPGLAAPAEPAATPEPAPAEPEPAATPEPAPADQAIAPTPAAAMSVTQPSAAASEPAATPAAPVAEPSLDSERLNAARERLRATAPADALEVEVAPTAPVGLPSPWLPAALRTLTRDDPETAGRIIAGMLPAQGLVTHRALSYDLVLSGRCIAVDVDSEGTRVTPRERPRGRGNVDFRVTTDAAGLARLLYARRGLLRRRARVRGSHRRLRELRRLANEAIALRDLAGAGATLDPVLALTLAALAIDPVHTYGHRFTIAHAALAGGPADAWLRIQNGAPPAVLRARPGEQPVATIRCTRGALLPVLSGIAPPRGEAAAAIDGDAEALTLVRGWIARVEFPGG